MTTTAARRVTTTPRLPGFFGPEPGVERYAIRGGGFVAIDVSVGDALSVCDPQGGQPCVVFAFAPNGAPVRGAVAGDLEPAAPQPAPVADMGRRILMDRGLDIGRARGDTVFGRDRPPGATARLVAQQDTRLVIGAPGLAMRPDQSTPPTDLALEVRRASRGPIDTPRLPDPFAEPRLEFTVPAACALAYEVGAGEYIQIIDVAGQQCSDFLAFDARRLQSGVERFLDATTTRTLMGASYPSPGLYSRFYDQDMSALVEVMQDTVGRHDTFGLACTARYYEDAGYPGHVNCTDNFNDELDRYGIARRAGWPALNLFFNTGIDAANQIYFDSPWSRAGDYVLFRAERDLVCATSACPDDISPANAWHTTDIHVRVYPARHSFPKAMGFRMSPQSTTELTKHTGFHSSTSPHTRQYAEYRGFWIPSAYTATGPVAEYYACRERAAVFDLSALRKFEILGPDAESLLQFVLTRDIRRMDTGQVVYSSLCYDSGCLLDDVTLFRLGHDQFRLVCGDPYAGEWIRKQATDRGFNARVKSSVDQLHNLSVQGPRSRDILAAALWTPPAQARIDELGWFRFSIARLGDANGTAVVVSRTGYTGELGYEVWCHPDDGQVVWDAIFEAGAPLGLIPAGLDALDMLRIEAGLVFAGIDFDDSHTPFESAIGFTVPASKQDDYIGKAALSTARVQPRYRLVGLELDGNETAVPGDGIYIGREHVGVVTSATRSPILRSNIAFGRIKATHAEPDNAVEIGKLDHHRKRIAATTRPLPFFDPDKTRVRS